MILKLLNGSHTKINLKKYLSDKNFSRSKFQKSIKIRLLQQYPDDNIFEEVYVPVEKFYLDFFIPSRFMVIECQGRQHVEHVKFFHRTKIDFNKQQERDGRKREWCKLNNFKLVEIYG
jgi:very-short-patch-repair endonuclease